MGRVAPGSHREAFGPLTHALSPTARPDRLRIRTRAGDRLSEFYTAILDLRSGGTERGGIVLTPRPASGSTGLSLVLEESPDAPVPTRPALGLYHFALLYPDRPSLGAAVGRVLDAGWGRIDGAADHGVSEAFYLRDPEGNGIELYRDRPPETWPREGEEVAMFTRPLDVEELVEDAGGRRDPDPPTLGHVHLHVEELEATGRFYTDVLGLEVRQSSYPGALFLAAGDYHHHLGLNVWARGRPPSPGATGLIRWGWRVPAGDVEGVAERARAAGLEARDEGAELVLADPDGIEVAVRGEDGA